MTENPIRAARVRLHLTRVELGEALGVTSRTVSYWETWRKSPGRDKIPALRKFLDLSDIDVWRVTHRANPKIITRKGSAIW